MVKMRLPRLAGVIFSSVASVGFLVLWARSYRVADGLSRGGEPGVCVQSDYGRVWVLYQDTASPLVDPRIAPALRQKDFKFLRGPTWPWLDDNRPSANGTTHDWRFRSFGFSSAQPAPVVLNQDGDLFRAGTVCPECRAYVPHWFLALLFSVPGVLWLRGALRRRRRRRLNLCVECGYDLRGSEGRCPECGQGIPAGPAAPPAPVPTPT